MSLPRARLVCPDLRWRRGSFSTDRAKATAALAAGVGGFILFGGRRDAVSSLTASIKKEAGRPLLIGADLERGPGQQVSGLTELPPPAALGYLDDLDATYAAGMITATEARAVGINWAFAPVCDLDNEPRNPIVQTRSFGADPVRVGKHAATWIRGCQEHGVMACAKHYPGHGRTTIDSHEGLPVVDTPAAELQSADVDPFAAAVGAGVGSVMPAHVAYPGWDPSGSAATFSPTILGFLRNGIGHRGLIVTDAFIMAGATAAAPEGTAASAAIGAGCDMLLYPTDWQGVVRALETVPAERAEAALQRYGDAVSRWRATDQAFVDAILLAEHRKFADGLADRVTHLVRGEKPTLGKALTVSIVDDDVGGPYPIASRTVFHTALRQRGVPIRAGGPGASVVLVYAEPRSWKGRAELGPRTLALLERTAPRAALVILFAHPRLAAQIPGQAPVLCCWHGQALMQRAAARWLS
jgi:beta-glucosidase-like glycosyl hydrolase